MEKILEINGVKYIQKSEYDKAKRDIDNIKQLVSSSIADLSNFVSNQSIAQSVEKPIKQEVKEPQNHSMRSKELRIRVSGKREYKIIEMTHDGYFYAKPNRKMIFDIRDVIEINKR